jgi:hypothetical protein
MVRRQQKTEDTATETTATSTPVSASAANILASMVLRNVLVFTDKKMGIPSDSEDFYDFSGAHVKVPVRAECIASQPLHPSRIIHFGCDFGYDGTVTTPKDPLTGMASASDFHDYDVDPSAVWNDDTWWRSHCGRMFYALSNNIRANNSFSTAELITITKALYGYTQMAMATMLYFTYYYTRLDGWMNHLVSFLKATIGGSAMFVSRDDLLGRLLLSYQEQFFPYPIFDFFVNRRYCAFSKQTPWYKYLLLVPRDTNNLDRGMARIFDASDNNRTYMHPQTYLENEGLWRKFCTDLVPLLWGKKSVDAYMGLNPLEYLKQAGWSPISYNHVNYEYLTKKFWTHPKDELFGAGWNKLPIRTITDAVTTKYAWYWDSDGKGRIFYIGPDAIRGPASPWLDPVLYVGEALDNYGSNDDDASINGSESLSGGINYVGDTITDLGYNAYFSVFPKHAFEYNTFESIAPDPDKDINDEIDTEEGVDANWFELMQYNETFSFPFRMPSYHWYVNSRKLHKLYANFFNLKLDDVELYKRQRENDTRTATENSGGMQW